MSDPERDLGSTARAVPIDLLEFAVEAFREPLLVIDAALRVVVANRAARELSADLKQGADSLLCCQLLHGRSAPCPEDDAGCPLRQIARGAGASTMRHEHPLPSGEARVVEITATPLHDPDGHFAGILQVFRDVTEAAKTEEIVSRALNEWLITADSVPDFIFLSDLEGRIIRCNDAARRFLGVSYQDLIGRELETAFQGVSGDLDVLRQGRGEMRCEAQRATLEVASYAADARGRRYGTVWVMRDVTTVRRLESIAASVDMMNNLGHVLGTVRHELGNPINAIKTALSVLHERFDSFPEEKKKAYLTRCLDDVARVQALIESLRTFNMFEAVQNERLDLLSFLASLAGWVKEQLQSQGIACELRQPSETAAVVLADRRALQQVLLGLISNAADAVAGRRRPRISLEVELAGDEVRVAVADNGAGIASTDLGMVFLPLFTTKPQGTGLGLAIARNLVTRMNGTIELRSRLGRGTRVEIVLPRAEAAERTA